jgi:hypothetical protein
MMPEVSEPTSRGQRKVNRVPKDEQSTMKRDVIKKTEQAYVRVAFVDPVTLPNHDEIKQTYIAKCSTDTDDPEITDFEPVSWMAHQKSPLVLAGVDAGGKVTYHFWYCTENGGVYAHGGSLSNIKRKLQDLQLSVEAAEATPIKQAELRGRASRANCHLLSMLATGALFLSCEEPFAQSSAARGSTGGAALAKKTAKTVKEKVEGKLKSIVSGTAVFDEWMDGNGTEFGTLQVSAVDNAGNFCSVSLGHMRMKGAFAEDLAEVYQYHG